MTIEQNKNFVQSSGGKTGHFKEYSASVGFVGCLLCYAANNHIPAAFLQQRIYRLLRRVRPIILLC